MPDKELSQQARWQAKMKAEGRCPKCGRPPKKGRVCCWRCLNKAKSRYKNKSS